MVTKRGGVLIACIDCIDRSRTEVDGVVIEIDPNIYQEPRVSLPRYIVRVEILGTAAYSVACC